MPEDEPGSSADDRAEELLRDGAAAEWRLLKAERKAERRLEAARKALADDEARLRRAQERLERSREAVIAAEADLKEVQARRAVGPHYLQD